MDDIDNIKNRMLGSLFGLVVGDAFCAPAEFSPLGKYNNVKEYLPNYNFNLPAGYWTDDTSMMLCIIDSILELKKIDFIDQKNKFIDWYKNGYNSSANWCFDIGTTTRISLDYHLANLESNEFSSPENKNALGNGSIMRISPISVFYYNDIEQSYFDAARNSSITHNNDVVKDATGKFSALISTVISKKLSKREIENLVEPVKNLKPTGHISNTLDNALGAFLYTENFLDGLTKIMFNGGDTDTIGAVYGQIAGAFYGFGGINDYLIKNVFAYEDILNRLNKFCNLVLSLKE